MQNPLIHLTGRRINDQIADLGEIAGDMVNIHKIRAVVFQVDLQRTKGLTVIIQLGKVRDAGKCHSGSGCFLFLAVGIDQSHIGCIHKNLGIKPGFF